MRLAAAHASRNSLRSNSGGGTATDLLSGAIFEVVYHRAQKLKFLIVDHSVLVIGYKQVEDQVELNFVSNSPPLNDPGKAVFAFAFNLVYFYLLPEILNSCTGCFLEIG